MKFSIYFFPFAISQENIFVMKRTKRQFKWYVSGEKLNFWWKETHCSSEGPKWKGPWLLSKNTKLAVIVSFKSAWNRITSYDKHTKYWVIVVGEKLLRRWITLVMCVSYVVRFTNLLTSSLWRYVFNQCKLNWKNSKGIFKRRNVCVAVLGIGLVSPE